MYLCKKDVPQHVFFDGIPLFRIDYAAGRRKQDDHGYGYSKVKKHICRFLLLSDIRAPRGFSVRVD
ncbi:MAG: hypothetical protein J6D10_11495, partial [Clostridia bacterium]|nr:hypothetical protein [Clostridia bacterium]